MPSKINQPSSFTKKEEKGAKSKQMFALIMEMIKFAENNLEQFNSTLNLNEPITLEEIAATKEVVIRDFTICAMLHEE